MIDPATQTQIDAALNAGAIAHAAQLAEAALAAGQRDAMLFNLAAWRREEDGDFPAAISLLSDALQLAPGDPSILLGIAAVLRKQARHDNALSVIDDAITVAPDYAAAWLERGYILHETNRLDDAGAAYARAATLDPALAPAFAGAAAVAARTGKGPAAREYAAAALVREPGNATAICAIAEADYDAGAPDATIAALTPLVGRPGLDPRSAILANSLLGDAHDRLGNTAAAYAAYARSKAVIRDTHAPQFGVAALGMSHAGFIDRMSARFAEIPPSAWATPALPTPIDAPVADRHIFLLGYPRSGQTLVENVLASLADVDALEEAPTFTSADANFWSDDGGLARLAGVTPDVAAAVRESYWRDVAVHGVAAAGRSFVDMDPVKSIKLPTIAKLFPDARVLLMRRDPRDVVWSCFRRNFKTNAVTYSFTSLEATARHYVATMSFVEQTRAVLPLNLHIVRYDELVTDFDRVTQDICGFTGLDWTPALRDFNRTAERRGVTTVSAKQVRQQLFNGSGQWTPYAREIETVLPILQPWIDAFGFGD